jgi:uncharacterized membrane protein YeiB
MDGSVLIRLFGFIHCVSLWLGSFLVIDVYVGMVLLVAKEDNYATAS